MERGSERKEGSHPLPFTFCSSFSHLVWRIIHPCFTSVSSHSSGFFSTSCCCPQATYHIQFPRLVLHSPPSSTIFVFSSPPPRFPSLNVTYLHPAYLPFSSTPPISPRLLSPSSTEASPALLFSLHIPHFSSFSLLLSSSSLSAIVPSFPRFPCPSAR